MDFKDRDSFMKYLNSVKGRDGRLYVELLSRFNFKLLTLDDLQDIELNGLMWARYDKFSIDLDKYDAWGVYNQKLKQAGMKSYHATIDNR